MGYRAIAATMYHSKATGTARLVMLAIAHFYDDKGENGAWPNQETIAKLANVSKRSVQRAIVELRELGEVDILVHRGRGKTFDRQTNRYFITIMCPDSCDSSINHRDLDDTGDESRRQTGPTMTPNWADLDASVVALTIKNNYEQTKSVISDRPILTIAK